MNKPNVLIVEDNKINALVLTKTIQELCHTKHVVSDKEAFQAVEDAAYDLIFMDINLGSNSLDGEEIMKVIKNNPKYQGIKIMAVTSYAMPGDKERFLNAGFDAYFSKPINKKEIIKEVEEIFGSSQLHV
jgi:two-component system cell cycle response regulator DivK